MTYEELLTACKDYILSKFDGHPEMIDPWRIVTYGCSRTPPDVMITERELYLVFHKPSEELTGYLGNLQERELL